MNSNIVINDKKTAWDNLLSNVNSTSNNSTMALNDNHLNSLPINYIDTLWMLVAFALIFMMIPGLALFYSGFVPRVTTMRIFIAMLMAFSIVCIQAKLFKKWFLFGYSLVFGKNPQSAFIGDFGHLFLSGVGQMPNQMAPSVSSSIFMIFQSLFAAITPCIIFGAIAERVTIFSFVVISFFWTSLVYDFVAYWTWNKHGWLNMLGVVDYAGGGPVHIASGFSALAFSLAAADPRRSLSSTANRAPTNTHISQMLLGTGLLWFGWFGFNGGSEDAINDRAINAVAATNLAACIAGLTWAFLDLLTKRKRKFSLEAFCSGAIAGLVAITPACGYVDLASSILIGFVGSVVCFLASGVMRMCKKRIEDSCDVFAVHGIGGMVGSIMTGILTKNSIASMSDSSVKASGGIDGNWMLVAYQALAVLSTAAWSFIVTFIIVIIYRILPFLKLHSQPKCDPQTTESLTNCGEDPESQELSTFNGIKRPNRVSPAAETMILAAGEAVNKSKEMSPAVVCALQRTKSSLRQKIELQNRVTVLTNHL